MGVERRSSGGEFGACGKDTASGVERDLARGTYGWVRTGKAVPSRNHFRSQQQLAVDCEVGHIGESQQAGFDRRDAGVFVTQPPSIVFVYSYLALPSRAL